MANNGGDVVTFAVSGRSPMFDNGGAVVGVSPQGTIFPLPSGQWIPSQLTDVAISGIYGERFDDRTYYN
jgi:hypothetical protein